MRLNEKDIYQILADLIPLDQVKGLHIDSDNNVLFSIVVDASMGTKMEDLRQEAEKAVSGLKDIGKVTVVLTAQKPAIKATSNSNRGAQDPHGMSKNPKLNLPIKRIIAVASGKGGVGKSTMAVNIAAAYARTGLKVGLLDADIYGPSMPTLTGLPNKKPEMNEDKQLIPFEAHGLKVMSIGFLVDVGTPMIWRGPMVQTAIYQMLRDVAWGSNEAPLDLLIIDMPPGTGDAQLTIAQKLDIDGAIIVSTPQDLALIDASKAIEMFNKTNVKVLGVIENMSTHICSACGHEEAIFGAGGAQKEASKRCVSYLGAVPLNLFVYAKTILRSRRRAPYIFRLQSSSKNYGFHHSNK